MFEAIVIGVIVGLGSGLLGSIAGPQISHKLDRERRKEIRREERHKELRAMIDLEQNICLKSFSGAFRLMAMNHVGQPLLNAYLDHLKEQNAQQRVVWRPYRIDDSQLRSDAERLLELRIAYDGKLTEGISALKDRRDEWVSEITNLEGDMRRLMRAIDERMDELAW